MKIDLHCHTIAVKSGESNGRNVTAKEFKDKVNLAGVKMVAITNHNVFDKNQYDEFNKEVDGDFILLPGIELDVRGFSGDKGHVVIVCGDDNVHEFTNKVKKLSIDDVNSFKIKLNDLIEFINGIECVVLVHSYGKEPSLSQESIEEIRGKISKPHSFFYEPANYRVLGILINHDYKGMMGSDLQNWEDYQNQYFPSIKLEVDSFKQFMLFLAKDEDVIETLLKKKQSHVIDIARSKNEKNEVGIFDDVNVFFGAKGTGKSVSLKKVKEHFDELGKNVSSYCPSDNIDKLDNKLKISIDEKKISNYEGGDDCKAQLKALNEWETKNVTQIEDYKKYIESRNQSKNKEKMKIVEISGLLSLETDEFDKRIEDYNSVVKINENLQQIDYKDYLNAEEQSTLFNLLHKIRSGVEQKYIDVFEGNISQELSINAVDKIKEIVEKKTESKTIPSTTGLSEFVKQRFSLEVKINDIIKAFNFEYEGDPGFVGILEDKKNLYKRTCVRMLSSTSRAEDGFSNINNLKHEKKILEKIHASVYDVELNENINLFKSTIYEEDMTLDKFLGVKKIFIIDNKKYEPSDGEATMIILDEALKEDYDVYILDEPEKSLGNNYVSDVLVNKINDLAKRKKIIVIVTHNANLAVRTLPYSSILKIYDNGEYKTYIGSPYTNKLVNVKDKSDTKLWKEESIKILEGGKEAFKERGDIYE